MTDFPINILDIAILAIVFISAIAAFVRGFIHEFLSILGWVGGSIIAFFGSFLLKPYVNEYIKNELLAQLSAGVVLFIVAMFILSYIAKIISDGVKGTKLNAIDRSIGFLFGVLRGFFLLVLSYWLFETLWPQNNYPDIVTQAKTIPFVRDLTHNVTEYFDSSMPDASNHIPNLNQIQQQNTSAQKTIPAKKSPTPVYTTSDKQGIDQLFEENN